MVTNGHWANEPATLYSPLSRPTARCWWWKRLPGPALDHFDGQPVSGLGPVPRTVLLLEGLLNVTVSIHRQRPPTVDMSLMMSSFLTATHVKCCRHGCEPWINEVTLLDVDNVWCACCNLRLQFCKGQCEKTHSTYTYIILQGAHLFQQLPILASFPPRKLLPF